MTYTIFGVFNDRQNAEDAVSELERTGYSPKDISIVMKGGVERDRFARDTGTNVAGGAANGAATGAVIGGITGLLIGLGAITIPGIGAILIGGPLAAAFGLTGAAATTVSGALTGAVAGGLVGALTGLGVPESDARVYEERINAGGILLAVPAAADEVDEVRAILEDYNADQIRSVTVPTDKVAYSEREHIGERDYRSEYMGSRRLRSAQL